MRSTTLIRWGGLTSMVAGVLWIGAVILMALRPAGVPGGPHRDTGDLVVVMSLSLVLMLGGLAALQARRAGGAGWFGKAGFTLPYLGAAVMFVSGIGLASGLGIPWAMVVLGAFMVAIGLVLFGVAALQARVVPPAPALLLIGGALALLLFNTEDWRAWLALPFGAAWAWLGYVLATGGGPQPASATATAGGPPQAY